MANFPISGLPVPEIDLRQISVGEWRALFQRTQSNDEGDATIAKVSGMTVDDVRGLKLYDYRALFDAILKKAQEPLTNDTKN